ncbi:MAG TPA: ankyrin repeat domain-containing protein, partial [Planctomycetaceae bacterium]|nr:ankyrin repeat domain-containing protein [Planctomycetaceae bacterium]
MASAVALLVGCGPQSAGVSLWEASRNGNVKLIKQHLAAGADVNAKDEDGNTPLHEAAGAGHKEIVELLIKAGADIDAPDQDGASPLQRANKGGHKEIAKLLFDRVEDEIQKLIRNANTCYWVGLSEGGYCQLFRRGTNLLEKAKIKLAVLPDVELSDKEGLEVLQQRVIALTKDLVEQVEVTHDTSHGVFPLFRFYTGDFELYEWIDDPWVMASTRAGRSLTETILAHWKTLPQMDVCFTRRTPHESLPTKTPQGEDILPAPALQNELAVIFRQQSKFFIHNELAIARALNETEKRQFYDTGLDAKISQKLGKAWGIPGLLEVNIQVLDQYNKYWFYDARGRYMDCATGEEKQSLNAFGFTIDVRPATRIIILVFCGLLILSILPVFLMNLASPRNSASMKDRPPFFSRVRQHVETSSKFWGTSATPQLAGFFLGIAVPVVGLVSIVHFLPSPKIMIHYTLWSVMLVACLTGVVPILISTMLAKRFFHWEPGRSGLRAFWFLLSVGCGSAVLMAFASYSYLYPGEASIIMIQHVIFQFLMAGGFAIMFFSSGVDNDQSAREDYYLLVGCSIASIGLLTGAYAYLPPEERIFMVFVYLAAFAVLVLTPLCHQIVVKRASSVDLAVSLILLSI